MTPRNSQLTLDSFTKYADEKGKNSAPEKLPKNGWKWVRLGDFVETTSGGTPLRSKKEYYGGNIPWVKSGELEDNWIYNTQETITEEGLRNSSAKIFPKGTLLVAMYGATVGKTAILGVDAATNQAVCAIFPKKGLIDPFFIRYFIIWKRDELIKSSFGGAQPNISQTVIRNLMIPLPFRDGKPDIEEQRRVVARVEELTFRIEQAKKLREEALKETEKIMQTALHQTFKKVEHYGFKTLSDVCIINPSKKEVRNLPEDMDVSFVPMSAVNEVTGEIENSSVKKLKDVRKGYTYFKQGDVIFAKITPCMENGKSAIAKNLVNGIGFGSTEFHVLRPSNEVTPEWIFYFIRQKSFRELAARFMTGSVGQQRVPEEFLQNARIPVPPIPLQISLTDHLNKIKRKIESLLEHQKIINTHLELLTQTILKKAFTGGL
ncbi:MAG: restriction endonuclease subunit S [Candidatus Bathyarchaeia archaeon]